MNTKMNTKTSIARIQVFDEIRKCMQIQYNGQLKFISPMGHTWNLYYRLGNIVWATDGTHIYRRLHKCLIQSCPQIDPHNIKLSSKAMSTDYADYYWLKKLYKNQKIEREQINEIVVNTIVEILLDLAHNVTFSSVNWELDQKIVLEAPIISTSVNISLDKIQKRWNCFSEAWLNSVYPHLSPIFYKLDISSEMYLISRFMISVFD